MVIIELFLLEKLVVRPKDLLDSEVDLWHGTG